MINTHNVVDISKNNVIENSNGQYLYKTPKVIDKDYQNDHYQTPENKQM
jgi:hypothetical protein